MDDFRAGAISYDPQRGLEWRCPTCSLDRVINPDALADEFRHHHGKPLARETSWSLSIRDCPKCHCDSHLNCNLSDDHPSPEAKVINQMISSLLITHSNGVHPPHDHTHPSRKVLAESKATIDKHGPQATAKAVADYKNSQLTKD